jgi:hypothetical protein
MHFDKINKIKQFFSRGRSQKTKILTTKTNFFDEHD